MNPVRTQKTTVKYISVVSRTVFQSLYDNRKVSGL